MAAAGRGLDKGGCPTGARRAAAFPQVNRRGPSPAGRCAAAGRRARLDWAVMTSATASAILHTNHGDIAVDLYGEEAPVTVENFVGLATGERDYSASNASGGSEGPFYDGSVFHRVIAGFMIQGGDPTGTGRGGPGYQFEDEFTPKLRFDRPYLLAMANAGPGTNGSQFFITVAPTPHLNDHHTIFGEVSDEDSRRVVDEIANVSTDRADRPHDAVVIESVEVKK